MNNKSNVLYCAVRNCDNNNQTNTVFSLHMFPLIFANRERHNLWKTRTGITQPITNDVQICNRHFKDTDFYQKKSNNKNEPNLLKPDAVPTKFLPCYEDLNDSEVEHVEVSVKRVCRSMDLGYGDCDSSSSVFETTNAKEETKKFMEKYFAEYAKAKSLSSYEVGDVRCSGSDEKRNQEYPLLSEEVENFVEYAEHNKTNEIDFQQKTSIITNISNTDEQSGIELDPIEVEIIDKTENNYLITMLSSPVKQYSSSNSPTKIANMDSIESTNNCLDKSLPSEELSILKTMSSEMSKRFEGLEKHLNERMDNLETKIEIIHNELKTFVENQHPMKLNFVCKNNSDVYILESQLLSNNSVAKLFNKYISEIPGNEVGEYLKNILNALFPSESTLNITWNMESTVNKVRSIAIQNLLLSSLIIDETKRRFNLGESLDFTLIMGSLIKNKLYVKIKKDCVSETD